MSAVKINKRTQTVNETPAKRTIKIRLLMIPALFVLLVTASVIQAQSLKLLRGNSYEIGLTKSKATFKIPVTINPATKGKLPIARLINISFQNPAKSVPDSIFLTELLIDTFKNAFLQVTVNNEPPPEQGKYQLIINVSKADALDLEPETLNVDITIKAAALYPPTTVIATRTNPFPFLGYCTSIKPLSLFELSRNSGIHPLSIREISLIDAKGAAITGTLTFEDLNKEIPVGRQASFPYKLSGNFPIGTVVGSYELTAPQLANPVPFTIQIITKRGGAWIVLVIFAGLLFGYLTRVFFEARIQRDKTILDAVELLQLIRQEKYNRPDEKFGNSLDRIYNDLKSSVDLRKTEDITRAATTARASLVTQIEAIKKEQTDNKTNLDNLNNFLSISWPSLPQQFTAIIDQAKLNLDKAVSDNEGYKVTSARTAFSALRKKMLEDCRVAARPYKQLLMTGLNDIKNSAFKTQDFYPAFQTALEALLVEVDKIPVDVSDNSEDKIISFQNLCQSISQTRSNMLNLLYNLTSGTKTLADGIAATFAASGNASSDLPMAYDTFARKLNVTDSRSLEDVLPVIRATLQEFQDYFTKALTDDEFGMDDAQKNLIRSDLKQGLYVEAANRVVGFIKDKERRESSLERAMEFANEKFMMAEKMDIPFNDIILQTGQESFKPVSTDPAIEEVAVEKLHTHVWRNLLLFTFWQTLLIGTGITLIGYTIFVDKFTGTFTDMIEIFSWSVVLDITLNSTLTTVAGRVPKKIGA